MSECIDLLNRFGHMYQIGYDPCYDPAHVPRNRRDPWMMTLPCERGVVYPFGGDRLAVEVDGRPITAKAVAAIPGVTLHQDGDTEKTNVFPIELFERIASVVKPRKRRYCHLTAEQKQAAGNRLRPYRFAGQVPQS